jgi:hypothetical protein
MFREEVCKFTAMIVEHRPIVDCRIAVFVGCKISAGKISLSRSGPSNHPQQNGKNSNAAHIDRTIFNPWQ